jgi:hypothetical protein
MGVARQTNFSAGELAPMLHGRTDLPLFGRGLRTALNFFISPHGAAVSRPGTFYVGQVKNPTVNLGKVRLMPFFIDEGAAYVLEFGDHYVRFWLNQVQVQSGGSPLEVVTPYAYTELPLLKWAQVGDVMTLTHPSHQARELTRLDATTWTLETVAFEPLEAYFTDVPTPYTPTLPPLVRKPPAHAGATAYAVDDYVLSNSNWYRATAAGTSATGPTTPPSGTGSAIADGTVTWAYVSPAGIFPDATHLAREWRYLATVVAQHTPTGKVIETLPAEIRHTFGNDPDVTTPLDTLRLAIYPDRPVLLHRRETAGLLFQPDGWDTYKSLGVNFYRGRGKGAQGLFGFVGTTAERDFVDPGGEPDYAVQPPRGTNPFKVFDNNGFLVRTEMPGCVAFFQDRRIFARTDERQARLFGSRTGIYNNFDSNAVVHVAGEALEFELASRRRLEIRHLLGADRLIVLTDAGFWTVAGHQGEPLDFDSIDARLEIEVGANQLPPLVVDNSVLWCRTKGVGVYAAVRSDGGYRGTDISILAQHLFVGTSHTVVDWCFAEDPWGLVWAVRADGVLLSLSFSVAEQRWGWTRHETDGVVESICSVPEGEEDVVYIAVKRTLASGEYRYIERFDSRVRRGTSADDLCLDSAREASLTVETNDEYVFPALDHLEGKQVWVTSAENMPAGPFTVTGGQIEFENHFVPHSTFDPPNVVVLRAGLKYECDLETLDIAQGEGRMRQKTVKRAGLEVDQSIGLYVGPDTDNLKPWRQRNVAEGFGAVQPNTTLVDMPVSDTFSKAGRIALRQTMPLPTTVVGLAREVDFGGE